MTSAQKKRLQTIRQKEIKEARNTGFWEGHKSMTDRAQEQTQKQYDFFQKRIEELKIAKNIAEIGGDEHTAKVIDFTIKAMEKTVDDAYASLCYFGIKKKNVQYKSGFYSSGTCFVGH